MALFKSTGILRYGKNKVIVEIDPGISDFYRSLIPKYLPYNRQLYAPHISVVRKETPPNMEYWEKYEGQPIEFEYDNEIQIGTVYFWLNCFSVRLEEIRQELGLPVSSPYTLPPEGYLKCFHSTLANRKNL